MVVAVAGGGAEEMLMGTISRHKEIGGEPAGLSSSDSTRIALNLVPNNAARQKDAIMMMRVVRLVANGERHVCVCVPNVRA